MKRSSQVLVAVLALLGIFWAGRESTHGLAAFWEHWWCPIPLVLIACGVAFAVASLLTAHRNHPIA